MSLVVRSAFFFFNDTATTEIYTLSLHDALPIYGLAVGLLAQRRPVDTGRVPRPAIAVDRDDVLVYVVPRAAVVERHTREDRKSTRLNSSHQIISYAVFCLNKKKIRSHPASRRGS